MNVTQNAISNQRSASPVTQAVQSAAARTGIDFDYLMDVARVESNFDVDAQASTSSARGLFQFTNQTWLSTMDRHGASHGLSWAADAIGRDSSGRYSIRDSSLRDQIMSLRDNPAVASSMAAALTSDNRAYMEPRIGRSAEPVDLYLAHFLGSGGAVNFLSAMSADPDQAAAPLLPEAASANQSIFYGAGGRMRSLSEIREIFRAKLDNGAAPNVGLTTAPQDFPSSNRSLPSQSWEMTMTSQSGMPEATGRPPLQMMDIQPMPKKLSMTFAADAYRRLASLSGGKL